ncbi:tRNA pseudouridine(55) synthase TruB [candidate division WOR-3 bacterium]|nr:tRNA pseudouridine(55) synthase TruB [candidate division WOR-3 bacterium]
MKLKSGIILLDKPKGISSRKALDIIIKRAELKKAGHAGTIDPSASGLLVILAGQATKLNRFILSAEKKYVFKALFGKKTVTDDSEGETIFEKDPGKMELTGFKVVLKSFTGLIAQRPPSHSAVKIHGKRAYKLARKGQTPELKERMVQVKSLEVTSFEWPEVEIEAVVTSGTYIRSLARDVGDFLNIGAYCENIRRISIGKMNVDEAINLEDEIVFYPLDKTLSHLPEISDVFTERDFFDSPGKFAVFRDGSGILSGVLEKNGDSTKLHKFNF